MIKEIKFQNVSKEYEQEIAVSSFSLSIFENEFVVIVGPSGSGKSSLLKMLHGSEKVSEGLIFFDDQVINNVPTVDRDVEIVFQHYAIDYDVSVEKNIIKSLKKKKLPKNIVKEKVLELARILEIEELLKSDPKQLSGGEKQRVALARALVCEPSLLLLDEPLSNLDSSMRFKVRLLLKKIHRKYKNTIIYVTHDQKEALTLGDKIVVLKDGVIQQVGTPKELYYNPSNIFVASFIGNPLANIIEGKIVKEKTNHYFKFGNEMILIPAEIVQKEKIDECINKEIVIAIRPNAIAITKEKTGSVVGKVLSKEQIGQENYIHIKVKGVKEYIRIQVESLVGFIENEEINILFNFEEAKLFLKS